MTQHDPVETDGVSETFGAPLDTSVPIVALEEIAGGKRVTFVGEVVAKVVTSEEAEHFADDLGDPRSTLQTGKTYEIVATSVRVPIERGG